MSQHRDPKRSSYNSMQFAFIKTNDKPRRFGDLKLRSSGIVSLPWEEYRPTPGAHLGPRARR